MSTKTVLGLAFAAVLASVTFATPAMAVPDEPTELREYAPSTERCLRPGDALYDHPEVVVEPCRPGAVAKPAPVTPRKAAAVEQDWIKAQVAGGALAGITLLGAGFVGVAGLRRRNRAEN